MKRLLKRVTAKSEPADTNDKKGMFTATDLVDILQQIEELSKCNVAIKIEDGSLLLGVGDSIYEISVVKEKRYPRRVLKKL